MALPTFLGVHSNFCGAASRFSSMEPPEVTPAATMAACTFGTFWPITTCSWPPCSTTPSTPGMFLMASTSARPSSFRTRRRRVMQCSAVEMFSVPPTLASTCSAICTFLSAMVLSFLCLCGYRSTARWEGPERRQNRERRHSGKGIRPHRCVATPRGFP